MAPANQTMETYHGHVRTPADAILLFEACRQGILPRVQRRLAEKERQAIKSGSVFVWDEREAGMRRWTDGKSWSASRVSGSFLTYREMEGKRGGNGFGASTSKSGKTPDSRGSDEDAEDGPDGYRYKPDGLMKQSFSITTSQGQHLHLISYYARSHPAANELPQPSSDPLLRQVQPPKGMYPESSVNDQQNLPVVTRSPMAGPPYTMSPHFSYGRQGATHPHSYAHHPHYAWPLSPLATPPGAYSIPPYAYGHLPPPPPGHAYAHPYTTGHPYAIIPAPVNGPYDRPPVTMAEGIPPPPHFMHHPVTTPPAGPPPPYHNSPSHYHHLGMPPGPPQQQMSRQDHSEPQGPPSSAHPDSRRGSRTEASLPPVSHSQSQPPAQHPEQRIPSPPTTLPAIRDPNAGRSPPRDGSQPNGPPAAANVVPSIHALVNGISARAAVSPQGPPPPPPAASSGSGLMSGPPPPPPKAVTPVSQSPVQPPAPPPTSQPPAQENRDAKQPIHTAVSRHGSRSPISPRDGPKDPSTNNYNGFGRHEDTRQLRKLDTAFC